MPVVEAELQSRPEPRPAIEAPAPYNGLPVKEAVKRKMGALRTVADTALDARFARSDTNPGRMEVAARALRLKAFDLEAKAGANTVLAVKAGEFEERLAHAKAEAEAQAPHIVYAADALATEALGEDKLMLPGRPITRVDLQEAKDASGISIKLAHDNSKVEQELTEVLVAAGATNRRDVTPGGDANKTLRREVMDSSIDNVVLVLERKLEGKGLVTVYARNRRTYAELNRTELGFE